MIEIKLQHHGKDTAVVLEGDNKQEIKERFWSFWNHGATNGELEWQSKTRATFWARGDSKVLGRDKILHAMENAMLFNTLEPLKGEGRAIKINSLNEVYQESYEGAPEASFRYLQRQEHGVSDSDAEGRFVGAKSSLRLGDSARGSSS